MSNRVLEVLEAVAKFGPASLDELSDELPRTRSSVYRALKSLEVDGWIRRSLNGRSFLLSSRMERLADSPSTTSQGTAEVIDILRGKLKNQRFLLTIVTRIKGNEFSIIDTNAFPIPALLECPYKKDILADVLAAKSESKSRTLPQRSAWLNNKTKLTEISKKISEDGYMISEELELGLLPVLVDSGELLIVILENKSHSTASLERLRDRLEDFSECLRQRNVSLFQDREIRRLLAG
jgi:hypothetical protein